jgi:hypothetical protein
MHDLSIRKVPGVGRVNERLLEALGIKVIVFIICIEYALILHRHVVISSSIERRCN